MTIPKSINLTEQLKKNHHHLAEIINRTKKNKEAREKEKPA